MELTILMPCLNEAETLATCIRKAMRFLTDNSVDGEVVIADNGSTDGSQEIAVAEGARVVKVPVKGYGAALRCGIEEAQGTYVIMGDSDDSYDFLDLSPFLEKLREGNDLVMGNRFLGGIEPGAMPPLHRYLGNPVLSFLGKAFFKSSVGDFHCGLRGFRRSSALSLGLECTGMEFASELVVKATLFHQRLAEVPTKLSKDGRSRPPHLRSWRDGWRHLRFLLLFSPRWLFLYPGFVVFGVGLLFQLILSFGTIDLGGAQLGVNSLVVSSAFVMCGYQSIWFAILTKAFSQREGHLPPDARVGRFVEWLTLERALVVSVAAFLFGISLLIAATVRWKFGPLNPQVSLRTIAPATTIVVLSVQTALSSLMLSILQLPSRRSALVNS